MAINIYSQANTCSN